MSLAGADSDWPVNYFVKAIVEREEKNGSSLAHSSLLLPALLQKVGGETENGCLGLLVLRRKGSCH